MTQTPRHNESLRAKPPLLRRLRGLVRRLPFVPSRSRYRLYWLTPKLAVSRAPTPGDWRRIGAAGISAVVDLRAEAAEVSLFEQAAGIEYLRMPIEEYKAPSEADLQRVASWICERLSVEKAVLVHCREGLGRSPLVACAALVQHGLSLETARQTLRKGRPEALLNEAQDSLLNAFALHRPSNGPEPGPTERPEIGS
jgi:protein tyrosine phosphatase (PTP) superfamily phosphohydrolase (DUF442 family)